MIKYVVIFITIVLASITSFAQTATGTIEVYIGNIIDSAPGNSGNNYNAPSTSELNTWDGIITNVLVENIATARSSANTLNYQITEFTDTAINQVFYVLEEKTPQSNYWGTYVFSKTPTRNNLILQAPHAKYDSNTGKQAVYCLKNTLAKALFINGTHRCNSSSFSTCSGTTGVCGMSGEDYRLSDMAHVTNAMFQKTTENVFNTITNSVFIQLHGFGKQATDPYVIMSNGTRKTPATDYAVQIRDALLAEDSSLTFEIAHLNTNWTRLIGFTNTQGRLINNSSDHCNTSATNTSGRFIHIEQERTKLRNDESGWIKMSNALSNVFFSTLSTEVFDLNANVLVFPNPTANRSIHVEVKSTSIQEVEVYNQHGQRIIHQKSDDQHVDFQKYAAGIYFLKIKTRQGLVFKKIMLL